MLLDDCDGPHESSCLLARPSGQAVQSTLEHGSNGCTSVARRGCRRTDVETLRVTTGRLTLGWP